MKSHDRDVCEDSSWAHVHRLLGVWLLTLLCHRASLLADRWNVSETADVFRSAWPFPGAAVHEQRTKKVVPSNAVCLTSGYHRLPNNQRMLFDPSLDRARHWTTKKWVSHTTVGSFSSLLVLVG